MKTKRNLFLLGFTGLLVAALFYFASVFSASATIPVQHGFGWYPVVAVSEGGYSWTECIWTGNEEDYCIASDDEENL